MNKIRFSSDLIFFFFQTGRKESIGLSPDTLNSSTSTSSAQYHRGSIKSVRFVGTEKSSDEKNSIEMKGNEIG